MKGKRSFNNTTCDKNGLENKAVSYCANNTDTHFEKAGQNQRFHKSYNYILGRTFRH